jgi:branched-subunit amino acid ABC-type transport system permease component
LDFLDVLMRILVDGLGLSLVYAMVAVGLTLIFGVLGILNFAHGEMVALGSWIVWFLLVRQQLPFWVTAIVGIIVVCVLGIIMERGLFKRMRGNELGGFLLSLGVVYILQVLYLQVFSPVDRAIPSVVMGTLSVFGTTFSSSKMVMMPIIALIILGVWMFLEKAKIGKAIRAATGDSEAASLHGISLDRISLIVMAIGSALAGVAGVILTQWRSVGPATGTDVVLNAFVIVVIGGLGSVGGTIIGAFIFAFLETIIVNTMNPAFSILLGVVMMLVILIIRPRGLFGRE